MSLPEIAIEKKAVTYFSVILLLVAGISSYFQLGQLEDPDFTVKTALVITQYPGASPKEDRSTSESYSMPNWLSALASLAILPSSRSNMPARRIAQAASTKLPDSDFTTAKKPQKRLADVRRFGSR